MFAQQLFGMLQCHILGGMVRARGLTINRPDHNKFLLYHVVFRRLEASARPLIISRACGRDSRTRLIDLSQLPGTLEPIGPAEATCTGCYHATAGRVSG